MNMHKCQVVTCNRPSEVGVFGEDATGRICVTGMCEFHATHIVGSVDIKMGARFVE